MIRLSRGISVRAFDLEATVALPRERPEFLAVARLAADLGGLTPAALGRELLPMPPVVLRQVLERCADLKLLSVDAQGVFVVTDYGRVAIEDGALLTPEEGLFRFYLADDPLIDDPVLEVRRFTESWRRAPGKAERIHETPEILRPSAARRRSWEMVAAAAEGRVSEAGRIELSIGWPDMGEPEVVVAGKLALPERDRQADWSLRRVLHATRLAQTSRDALWVDIVASVSAVSAAELWQWRERYQKHVWPVAFEAVQLHEQESMETEIDVDDVSLGDLGRLRARVRRVPLVPRTDADAQAWLEALQWGAITTYQTPAMLAASATALMARFPHHRTCPLTPDALVARARSAAEPQYWCLHAPADLSLWSLPCT